MRTVAITGLGAVHPFGRGAEELWAGVCGEIQGVRPVRRFDASRCATRFAAQLPDELRASLPHPELEWSARYALAALDDALADAGLDAEQLEAARCEGHFGFETTSGDFEACARVLHAASSDGRVDAERLHDAWREGRAPALAWGLHEGFLRAVARRVGPLETLRVIGAACASGAEAIGAGLRAVRSGRVELALVGGSDAKVSPIGLGLTSQLGMTSRRNDDPAAASRPFDRSRDGAVLGEGAAVLVLEDLERAVGRGARIRALLCGFASSCDASRLTDPAEDGACAALAVRAALRDAGLDRVDYVNAHGTSTLMNDRCELTALAQVFGASSMPLVSSTKGATGHLMAASGALEAVVCTLALERREVPPTLNHQQCDAGWEIDVVAGRPRRVPLDSLVSSSFGFGGQNACLVLRGRHAMEEAIDA